MTSDFPSGAQRSNRAQGEDNDNAFARLEKEMANMRDASGNLSDQISDAASDIGAVAQDQAKRGIKHAQSMANDASDRLGVVADRARSQAASLGDSVEDAVQERPLSILALALGLGFLAGAILRR